MIPRAGGPQAHAGDYLYYNGRSFKLREGSWGILRVLGDGGDAPTLQKLPGHERPPAAPASVCPADAPVKRFDVAAIERRLPMLRRRRARCSCSPATSRRVLDGAEAAAAARAARRTSATASKRR